MGEGGLPLWTNWPSPRSQVLFKGNHFPETCDDFPQLLLLEVWPLRVPKCQSRVLFHGKECAVPVILCAGDLAISRRMPGLATWPWHRLWQCRSSGPGLSQEQGLPGIYTLSKRRGLQDLLFTWTENQGSSFPAGPGSWEFSPGLSLHCQLSLPASLPLPPPSV